MGPWHAEETEHRGWFSRLHLSWPMLFLAGWLVYEFTAQPGLAALVACAKFGLADVRTAFWLRRVDPDRRRGQTCFWAYLTYGLWKVGMMAGATMLMIAFVVTILVFAIRQVMAINNIEPVFHVAVTAGITGAGLFIPTAYVTMWLAWRNGIRIWLGYDANRARKERFWPPGGGRINAAPFVFTWSISATLLLFLYVVVGLAVALWRQGVPDWILILAGILILFFVILTWIVLPERYMQQYLQLFARSPQECWNAAEDEAVYQVRDAEEEMSNA